MKTSKFNDAVIQLVDLAMNNLSTDRAQAYKKQMSPLHFIDQFATVKVSLPRGMGHSTTALNLMLKYMPTLLIEPNSMLKRHTENMLREHIGQYLYTEINPKEGPKGTKFILNFEDYVHNQDHFNGMSDTFNVVIFDTISHSDYHKSERYREAKDILQMQLITRHNTLLFVELG